MATASNGVDVSSWSFWGRGGGEVFLVGPIVGAVTMQTARVLVEMAETTEVTMEAFMDDESVCTETREVEGRTPTAFHLSDFKQNSRVRVVVSAGGEEREARFVTPSQKLQWKVAAVSCNCFQHTEKIGLFEKLSRVIDEVDCILHLGDQVYCDSDYVNKKRGTSHDSAWLSSIHLLEPLTRDEWDDQAETVLEFYRRAYRTTWNIPDTAKVLASAANYMICDDHEFTDDLGDEPEHSNPSTVEFYVARLAYRVYNEYQRQLLEDVDVTDVSVKPYYAYKLSPRVGFFMTDNRVERSLHRAQATMAEWTNRKFLGPDQWNRLITAFERDFEDCDMVFFGAPTPLVFVSQKATWLAQKKIDDARGTWGHEDFEEEQKALCKLLVDWQEAKPNRAVIPLGGDVHMGGFTDAWPKGANMPLHLLTSSAIGNMPEGGLDGAKEMIARAAMHADAKLFKFKVNHHEWIYGPNYGIIDFILSQYGRDRPQTTMTLVGEDGDPKIRNLTFGDSGIEVKDEDQSEAAIAAHATADVMEPSAEEAPMN